MPSPVAMGNRLSIADKGAHRFRYYPHRFHYFYPMIKSPEPSPKTASPKPYRTPSFYMALLAIVISLVGTCVSIFEARILREQQTIMSEEKEASVWPYLSANGNINMGPESTIYSLNIKNEGVGPALLGDISHTIGEKSGTILSILSALNEKYPSSTFFLQKSFNGKKKVIGEGEVVNLFQLAILDGGDISQQADIIDSIESTYCYCSIYGDCWSSDGERMAENESCSGRDYLR